MSSYIRKTDQQLFQENWPAHITAHKMQTQGAIKNYCKDKFKAKAFMPAFTQNSKPSNKAKKNKKKKQYKERWDFTNLAIRVNKAEVVGVMILTFPIMLITYLLILHFS